MTTRKRPCLKLATGGNTTGMNKSNKKRILGKNYDI